MFQHLISDVFVKFFSSYLQNADVEVLRSMFTDGSIILRNIELKKQSLEALQLPVFVSNGFVGEVKIQIPWKDLQLEPVIVYVDNVHLILVPKHGTEYTDEDAKLALERKRELLDAAEELREEVDDATEQSGSTSSSFFAQLVTKIFGNLQVYVNHVHIRYEDHITMSESTFAVGLSLSRIAAYTADTNWQQTLTCTGDGVIFKAIELKTFAVYVNPRAERLSQLTDKEDIVLKMDNVISGNEFTQFVVKPLNAQLHVRWDAESGVQQTAPQVQAELLLDEICVAMNDAQYADLLSLTQALPRYQQAERWRQYRPSVPVKGHARVWWAFAGLITLEQVTAKIEQWSWQRMKQRRDDRERYVAAYINKLALPAVQFKLTPDSVTVEEIETKYDTDDILFFRLLTQARMKRSPLRKAKQNTGIGMWSLLNTALYQVGLTGTGRAGLAGPSVIGAERLGSVLNVSEREQLSATLDGAGATVLGSMPKEYVHTKLSIKMDRGSFSILKGGVGIAEAVLTSTQMVVALRPTSYHVMCAVHSLVVEDLFSQNSHFKRIVTPRAQEQFHTFTIEVEKMPSHSRADMRVRLRVLALDVFVIQPTFLEIGARKQQ